MKTKLHIADYVLRLHPGEHGLSVPRLAEWLNENGCRTGYGTIYCGLRGTYRTIKATYDWLMSEGRFDDAEAVACAFVNRNGQNAWA
jgi:hypothetical protein